MIAAANDPCSVSALRRRGLLMIAMLGWASVLAVTLVAFIAGQPALTVFAVGALVNLLPSWAAATGRHDGQARLLAGTLAAAMPALLVYALAGHEWQMDAHMYFFVALALLTVLCDWRPIALASGLIALHHLALEWIAPDFVFAGEGNLGRVLFHAAAVIMQFAVLAYITTRLAKLVDDQDRAVADSGRLAAAAEAERARAEAALKLARAAEAQAERARAERREVEQRHAAERRDELLAFAADFERSVAGIAVAIEGAASGLDSSAAYLDTMFGAAGREAGEVAANAVDATGQIRRVAGAIATLGHSIGSIAAAAEQQRELTEVGRSKSEQSSATIAALTDCAQEIGGFIDQIRAIAAKTNLLALNATIEAARAGDAGRGFAVVAGEVKGLAAETERASGRIVDILNDVRRTAVASGSDAELMCEAVLEVSDAAHGIAAEAADQRRLATAIEDSVARAASNADLIEQRIEALAERVATAGSLAADLRGSTRALSRNAHELRGSADRFVRHLREVPLEAAA
ncbi:methyl-accepting chemotaxis protein [Sphingomonas sp. Y38-1Y]|uniref:methyl-accepting chemotaxis protein n=1 Tax=Sphingomonas sp. Y38-1Y TaxID=3078265 RepID=UPI0028ED5CCA|nr:methyl-accepting chemotaxis protein [Sphingomonas sp. Y38-1Y]